MAAAPLPHGKEIQQPTYCATCGLVFTRGRWSREAITRNLMIRKAVPATQCPACFQTQNRIPGAMLTILSADRLDLEKLDHLVQETAHYIEQRQPLERLIIVKKSLHEWDVHTTGIAMAEKIARELVRTFGGRVQQGRHEAKLVRLIYVPSWGE